MTKYVLGDFFSGCGGFSLGFHETGKFRSAIAVDHWDVSLDTLKCNLDTDEILRLDLSCKQAKGLLTNRYAGELDAILGGPPCQGFSTLGKRRDGDRRSTLVDDFAQLCIRLRPKLVIVENVRGILTKKHPRGGTYASALINALTLSEECPFVCSDRMLNAMDFGIPQTRVRWFMLAIRRDQPGAEAAAKLFWQTISAQEKTTALTLRDSIGDLPKPTLVADAEARIPNHRAMNHSNELVERLRHVPAGGGLPNVPTELLTPHLRKMLAGKYGSGGHVKNVYGRMEWGKPSGTIVAGIDKITCGRFVHPEQHRLLTPRECARIQSFPDSFIFKGGQVAQYYQIGNAVPPKLAAPLAFAASQSLSFLADIRRSFDSIAA